MEVVKVATERNKLVEQIALRSTPLPEYPWEWQRQHRHMRRVQFER
jgi:hypothetical protein